MGVNAWKVGKVGGRWDELFPNVYWGVLTFTTFPTFLRERRKEKFVSSTAGNFSVSNVSGDEKVRKVG